jgi:hypothetical protein
VIRYVKDPPGELRARGIPALEAELHSLFSLLFAVKKQRAVACLLQIG